MRDKVNKDYENQSYWEQVRDFRLSRTPFWISISWQLLATILPWLAIWLTIGPDFCVIQTNASGAATGEFVNDAFNFFTRGGSFAQHGVGFVAFISCMYLIWAMGICTFSFFMHWQKADGFTYTLSFALIGFMIIMNGAWEYDWTNGGDPEQMAVRVIVDFIICIFTALFGMILGVMVTTFARNYAFKIEEEDEAILIAYENGEEVPTKKQLRIERAKEAKKKREQEAAELEIFKQSIDDKIEQKFIEEQKKREEELTLTKEERKKLKKERKAEAKKQRIFDKKNKHSDSKEIHGLD